MSDRAERLGASLLLFGLVREPAAEALDAAQDLPLLTAEEWEAWRDVDEDDVSLAHACLAAEFEARARQWQALEFLLHVRTAPAVTVPIGPPGAGSAGAAGPAAAEPMVLVSRAEGAALALAVLAWHGPPPEGADA